MKKTIGIVSHRQSMAEFYGQVFQELFGDEVDIVVGATENDSVWQMGKADLYVSSVTSYDVMQDSRISEYVNEMPEAIRMDVTFSKAAIDLLRTYPDGTKALLVNQNTHMVMECITQLYHLGITNIEFYPCYPGIDRLPAADLTFTVGEPDLVPEGMGHVVDIGSRLPSANTICETALKLGDAFFLEGKRFKRYRNRLASVDYSLETISSNNMTAENRLEIILNALDVGIVCVNKQFEVVLINKTARKMLNVSRSEVLGKPASEVLPELYAEFGEEENFNAPRLLNIQRADLGAVLMPLKLEEMMLGSFVTLQSFRETERQQNTLRRQKTQQGRKAEGQFKDMIGSSAAINRMRELAKRMAYNDAPIHIQGEAGTGKGLLAQAIHS
ncbi:MAG: PAS domain-containing protein [Oscillospiraceae bacterium]|nr:PAS domain-containing protein [Oscillospiraceae bacterium]